jgi:iron complex outermembrane receptor protein
LIVEHYETSEYNNFYPPQSDVNFNLNLDGTINSARTASWTNKLISRFGYTPSFDLPNNANSDTQERLNSTTNGISNEFNWNIGSTTLTSVTAWRSLYFRPTNDSDGTPYPIFRGGFDVDVDQYSQELRLASDSTKKLEWTIGGYYLHEDLTSNLRYDFFRDATKFLISPALPSSVLADVNYSKDGQLAVDSAAVFGQATWHITPAFAFTGGLRYTNESKTVEVTGSTTGGATLPAALAAIRGATLASFGGTAPAAGGIYAISAKQSDDAVAWLINPSYQINDDFLLWGSISYGEKSGAANTTASPTILTLARTAPEKSTAYQAGIKTSWADKHIIINLDIYRNDIDGYQASQINPLNPAIGSILANVGSVRLQGVELDAAFYPAKGLTLNISGAYNDAKYRSYPNAPAPIEYQVALGGTSAVLDLSGYRVAGAPLWNGQASINYTTPISETLTFDGYINGAYRSGVALLNPRSAFGYQGAYGLINAGVSLRNPASFWSVQLWAKNLFDERYAIGYGAATGTSPVIEIMGEPRRFGLTLAANF